MVDISRWESRRGQNSKLVLIISTEEKLKIRKLPIKSPIRKIWG